MSKEKDLASAIIEDSSKVTELEKLTPADRERVEREMLFAMIPDGANDETKAAIRKSLRQTLKSQAFIDSATAGVGLIQALTAFDKNSKLSAGGEPDTGARSESLSALLSQAMSRSQQPDSQIRSFFADTMAENTKVAQEASKASGTLGQYASNVQAIASGRNKAAKEMARELDQDQLRWASLASNLAQAEINEGQMMFERQDRQYGRRLGAFMQSRDNLNKQAAMGLQNMFYGAEGAATSIPTSRFAAGLDPKPEAASLGLSGETGAKEYEPFDAKLSVSGSLGDAPGTIDKKQQSNVFDAMRFMSGSAVSDEVLMNLNEQSKKAGFGDNISTWLEGLNY